ncbi:MAG TPA: fibronectin type III domain-containing protein, partial [Acidimicrobiales bacterium]
MKVAVMTVLALGAGLVNAAFVTPSASADPAPPIPAVTYAPGDIDGQNGWAGTGGGNIENTLDQSVVANTGAPGSFIEQSWRFSNSVTSGAFGNQPFSPSVDEAGETSAESGGLSGGSRSNQFVAEWDFASAQPGAEQPGLGLTASPDRGDGARMSWVRMEDAPGGLRVLFSDYQRANDPECDQADPALDGFVDEAIASGLDRGTAHSIRIEMDFVDGPQNDVVRVFVDGSLAHTGTSWEDYFRDCEGNATRTVDSLLFRSSGAAAPANAGKGFLIDNVALTSGSSAFSTGFEPNVTVSSTTTEVTGLGGRWFAADTRPGGQLVFDETYGGSLGDGAAILSTTSSSAAKVQLFTDLFGAGGGTALADVDAIAYSTYRDTAPVGSPALPALNLRVDADNVGGVDTYLVYEPYQDFGNDAVHDDDWQTWNAIRGGAAKWWSSDTGAIPGCGQATPCTWSAIVAAHPDARVVEPPASPTAPGSLGINLGSGNPSVTAAVDRLAVTVDGDRQIFDFEAIFAPGVPTGLTATPGDGIVDLSWDAPTDDGGSPVTTYHVYRDGVEVGTTSGDTTFQDTTANGAVPSSLAYSYTVSAENAVDEGDESAAAIATVNLFWEGYEWDVENGTAVINGDGGVDLTRNAAGESWIRLVGAPPINGNSTPWVEFSYHDDGDSWQGIDMFVDSTGGAPNPRLQAGSLFTAERLGYARYTD